MRNCGGSEGLLGKVMVKCQCCSQLVARVVPWVCFVHCSVASPAISRDALLCFSSWPCPRLSHVLVKAIFSMSHEPDSAAMAACTRSTPLLSRWMLYRLLLFSTWASCRAFTLGATIEPVKLACGSDDRANEQFIDQRTYTNADTHACTNTGLY